MNFSFNNNKFCFVRLTHVVGPTIEKATFLNILNKPKLKKTLDNSLIHLRFLLGGLICGDSCNSCFATTKPPA